MPVSDRSTLETKAKDPERQRKGKTSHETHMKKLKEKLLKDNQEVKMTLKRIYRIFSARLEQSSIHNNSDRRNNAYYERRTQC